MHFVNTYLKDCKEFDQRKMAVDMSNWLSNNYRNNTASQMAVRKEEDIFVQDYFFSIKVLLLLS